MTFWEHFLRLLPHRPTQALAALYWHVTRRRVRARNRLQVASVDLPFAYDVWIDKVERTAALEPQLRASMSEWVRHPQFCILLYTSAGNSAPGVARSRRSIEKQIYPSWNVVQCEESELTANIARCDDAYIVPLRAGDELSNAALFHFAEVLQTNADASILYGDHDQIDPNGRRSRPWFKPDWNSEMFLAQDYVLPAVAIAGAVLRLAVDRLGNTAELSALMVESALGGERIVVHVPHILMHVDALRPEKPQHNRLDAVARHVGSLGGSCSPGRFGTIKVEWPLPGKLPLVSVIVPTKDKIELLKPCIESVLERTNYRNFELIIVDNGSVEPCTASYLQQIEEHPQIRVLHYRRPYNFSSINNFAAQEARGAFLCLLNNDTEVIEPDWLTEMMRYAVRPDIGAVGAKLLYEDGSIQHAGVVVGVGEAAGHAHRFLPGDDPGYFRQAHVSQFVSAVTAACMVVDKAKFDAVGGLDEEGLKIAFNDVDLCLKLQAAGWRNVYVPHATLVHHESKSRGKDMAPMNINRYMSELGVLQERWKTKTYQDPLHNPNLDRYNETFVFRI